MMAGASSGESSGLARTMMSKGHHSQLRRRRKGTIAGFAHGKEGEPTAQVNSSDVNGDAVSPESVGTSGPGASGGQGNQPQHTSDPSTNPLKPCHSARLAIACCQNSIRMGARTQLGLCPPGRARRGLQAALRQRTRSHQQTTGRRLLLANFDTGGYYGLDKMIGVQSLENYEEQEEDYLLSTNTFDVESDEEASSGDEDELNNIDDLLSAEPSALDEEKKYVNLREPLFTPAGAEGGLSNPNGAPSVAAMGGGSTNKLPFNRRKLRYFDAITATDRSICRSYLRQEATKCKLRGAFLLKRRLRLMQREERRRRRAEKGELPESESDSETEEAEEKVLLASGISQFQHPMSASLSAALILESLSLNPLESIEGMAKCYDGIVAAGVALLDAQMKDPTSPTGEEEKPRPSRSEIMAALAPLLITSLEQPSGDVVLLLAKLRRMCGTYRYQRRFVQRVAPCLIRPARAAMWCPRHQNDMEPIVAAAELIFDSASEVFSKGWYDRGQLLLADSKRAETLNTAAMQLRNLSAEPSEGLSLGFTNHGHGHRRSMFIPAHSQGKDAATSANDLAEWEVIAVDRQIRISISNILSSDWTRVVTHSREEMTRSYHTRRSVGSSGRRPSVIPQASSGDASPRSLSSPRSPTRMVVVGNTPMSPPNHAVGGIHGSSGTSHVESFENIFSTSLPTQPTLSVERPVSPDPTTSTPAAMTLSPPLPHRTDEADSHTPPLQHSSATPPRSPRSPSSDSVDISQTSTATPVPPVTPISPRRKHAQSTSSYSSRDSSSDVHQSAPFTPSLTPPTASAPLSPASVASVGTSVSASELVSYRPSSSPSVNASTSQTAHYRMLTSTASERKRTVAACRALRAQITRFEDAFFQLHGRPPKGAAERAPLATTYSQYREWKRAIRADAACRIQALFRGYLARWMLLRSKDPAVIRVVQRAAGTPSFAPSFPIDQLRQESGQEILLPIENEGEKNNPVLHPIPGGVGPAPGDVYLPPASWNSGPIHRPRAENPSNPAGQNHSYPSGPAGSMNPPELAHLSLADLQARKRELKQELKRYDMNFARRHGRMPVKAEKEPIRHLYENYNALKSQISMLEQDGRHGQSPSQPNTNMHSRSLSPASSSMSQDTSGDSESTNASLSARSTRRKAAAPPPMLSTSTPSGAPSQDLAALKAEKGQLHQMLRSYERDFFREHRRQVSSFADIRPVASQYRRYKEIKKAIAALQQQGGEN